VGRADRRFEPTLDKARADTLYAGWREAVGRVQTVRPGK
jgi:glycerol kinase